MKIAYSVNGEGFGHAARLLTLAPGLRRWHDLVLFLPDTVRARIRVELPDLACQTLPAFELVKKVDRIMYFRTILKNLVLTFRSPWIVFKLARLLKKGRFDGVVSDFEPFLAWAGKLAGLKVVQLNHPGIVRRFTQLSTDSLCASLVATLMEGPWDRRILCSFFQGDIGPLLRPELLAAKPSRGEYLLVNLKTGYRDRVVTVLNRLSQTMPGLRWEIFPRPDGDFATALASCRAVISAAGHQMLSEALVLGKPILALPQGGQFEQELNARRLVASGRGMAGSLGELSGLIPQFMESLPALERACNEPALPGFCFRDSTELALRRIVESFAGHRQSAIPGNVQPFVQLRKRA